MVPLLAINTSPLPLILLYRVQASRRLAQVGIQEKLIGWIMNGTNVSEPKSVPAQGKVLPVQLTLVLHENISGASLSFVIQNHPLSLASRSSMKQLVMPPHPMVGLGLAC